MTTLNMEQQHTFDFLTIVGVAALMGQILVFGLMTLKISWAVNIPDMIPGTFKKIIAVFVVSLWPNSCSSWYLNNQGHFQTALYFSLMIFSM